MFILLKTSINIRMLAICVFRQTTEIFISNITAARKIITSMNSIIHYLQMLRVLTVQINMFIFRIICLKRIPVMIIQAPLSYLSYRKSRKVVVENKKSFIIAKYLESLIMVAIAGLICFLFAILARFLEIQWGVLTAVLGFIYLTLPVISIFSKIRFGRRKRMPESD